MSPEWVLPAGGGASQRRQRLPGRLARAGWMLGEWAIQPFFTLVTTFVYAPYFATRIVGDPSRGQALWGVAAGGAGAVIALLAPLLGAIADAGGRRKPWLAAFGSLLIIGAAALWWGRPQDQSSVLPVLVAYALGAIGAQGAAVFLNAMMPSLVPVARLGRLSGTGWAVGYAGGLASLLLTLVCFAADPQSGQTWFGFAPLLALKPGLGEGDRASGPLTAVWALLFGLPLFWLTPDPPRRCGIAKALRQGLASLGATSRQLPANRDLCWFLAANMIYADALVALFAFGGIYSAGTFGWSTVQIAAFGILLAVMGAVGAFFGGKLDDRFGAKRVILGSLIVLILASLAMISISRDRLGFVVAVEPLHGESLFGATAERVYVAVGLVLGAVAGPLQAASRSLLARLAPEQHMAEVFGLFALSGRVTSFVGPLLVGALTALTANQKSGMAVLIAFFVAGALALSRVRVNEPRRARNC